MTRPPETGPTPPLDPGAVIAVLEEHAVRYVVIGGVAAQLHGSLAPTRGLDITPERSAANLARVAAALGAVEAREWVPGFGYPLQMPMDRRRLADNRVLLTQTKHGRVDVVPAPHGLPGGYQELSVLARPVAAYGAELRVAALEDLVRSHSAASRAKDQMALTRLHDLKLRSSAAPLPPHTLATRLPSHSQPGPTLHDALAASERLATVFDVIRPQMAYVRRELYRAVDSAMYGDGEATRNSIGRAQHAGSNAQADIWRLRHELRPDSGRTVAQPGLPPVEADGPANLTQQASQELHAALRLLAAAASQRAAQDPDGLRDLLIEARVHAATADNHLDLLQIQLEHLARGWEVERAAPGRNDMGDGRC